MDENATSSSSAGAMPVHSELRQPRTSSSSASSSRRSVRDCSAGTGARLPELLLERVAVDAVVVPLELVHELIHLGDGGARHDPERRRLAAASVLLARVLLRE